MYIYANCCNPLFSIKAQQWNNLKLCFNAKYFGDKFIKSHQVFISKVLFYQTWFFSYVIIFFISSLSFAAKKRKKNAMNLMSSKSKHN